MLDEESGDSGKTVPLETVSNSLCSNIFGRKPAPADVTPTLKEDDPIIYLQDMGCQFGEKRLRFLWWFLFTDFMLTVSTFTTKFIEGNMAVHEYVYISLLLIGIVVQYKKVHRYGIMIQLLVI